MPSIDQITEKVFAAIADVKRIPPESVSAEQSLTDDLGFDSMDTINLLFNLEEAFHISIPEENAKALRKVSDIVSGLRILMAKAA
jgi:acyl carrier protein